MASPPRPSTLTAPIAQPVPSHARPKTWTRLALALVVLVAAGGWWIHAGHGSISLPERLDGAPRVVYRESEITSPFDMHPRVRLLEGGYGADPSAPGSFGVSLWIAPTGQNGTTPLEILTLGLPAGVEVDMDSAVDARVGVVDFRCVPSTTNASTMCAWSEGDVAGFVGTRERDLHQALAQTERIETEIGA